MPRFPHVTATSEGLSDRIFGTLIARARARNGRVHALHATIRFGGKTQFVTGARVNIDPASPPQSIVMTVVPGEDDRIVEDAPAPVPRAGQTPPPPGMIPPRGQPPVR